MLIRTYQPAAPLDQHIELLWYFTGAGLPAGRERVLPTGAMDLIFNLAEDEPVQSTSKTATCQGAVLCGAYSESFNIQMSSRVHLFGIHFKPGGAYAFLGMPASELHNMHVALDDLWGNRSEVLREQLQAAGNADECFRVAESALWQRLLESKPRHRAVDFALHKIQRSDGTLRISDLSEEIGLSTRRFIQLFSEQVGLTPKLFFRVRRLQAVVERLEKVPLHDWTELAHASGYYDQSHFIHEFRALSGLSPTAYLKNRSPHSRNHVTLV